jgi:hypothetical protein
VSGDGVAGAAVEPGVIVLTGIAGLLAGAFSMAAGEFISMLSQREMFEHQIAQEADELKRYPKEEAEELALIYAARGLDKKEARSLAKKLIANPDHALDTLAREELGLNPDDLGSPIGAAISSFIAFSIGASLPHLEPVLRQERLHRRFAHVRHRRRRCYGHLFHRLPIQCERHLSRAEHFHLRKLSRIRWAALNAKRALMACA